MFALFIENTATTGIQNSTTVQTRLNCKPCQHAVIYNGCLYTRTSSGRVCFLASVASFSASVRARHCMRRILGRVSSREHLGDGIIATLLVGQGCAELW